MKTTFFAFGLLFAVAACGGATSPTSSSSPAPNDESSSSPGTSTSTPALPKDPVTNDPSSTISFNPTILEARRAPLHAGCMEKNAPFTDDDIFTLQVVKNPPDNPRISGIAVSFNRTVTVGTPVDLIVGGSTGGGKLGDGKMEAHAPDDRDGLDVTVFHPGFLNGEPPVSTLAKARVTVLAVATKDGDPLAARVELTLADGATLDATYVAPLKSSDGACGGGGKP